MSGDWVTIRPRSWLSTQSQSLVLASAVRRAARDGELSLLRPFAARCCCGLRRPARRIHRQTIHHTKHSQIDHAVGVVELLLQPITPLDTRPGCGRWCAVQSACQMTRTANCAIDPVERPMTICCVWLRQPALKRRPKKHHQQSELHDKQVGEQVGLLREELHQPQDSELERQTASWRRATGPTPPRCTVTPTASRISVPRSRLCAGRRQRRAAPSPPPP